MRWFEITLKWGRRKTSISLTADSSEQAAMAALRIMRENWRGPKPLALTIAVAPKKSASKATTPAVMVFQWQHEDTRKPSVR